MVFSVAFGSKRSTLWKLQQRLSPTCHDDELSKDDYIDDYYEEEDEEFDFSTIATTTSFFYDDPPTDLNDINSFDAYDSASNDSPEGGRVPSSRSRQDEQRKQIQANANPLDGNSVKNAEMPSLQRTKQRTTRNWMSPSFYFCGYSIEEETPTNIMLQKPLNVAYKQEEEGEEKRLPPPKDSDGYKIPHAPSRCSESESFYSQQADQTTVTTTSMITQITTPSMIARANHICEDSYSDEECPTKNMKPLKPSQVSADRRKKKKQVPSAYFEIHNIPHAPSHCQSIESFDSFDAAWLPSPPSDVNE